MFVAVAAAAAVAAVESAAAVAAAGFVGVAAVVAGVAAAVAAVVVVVAAAAVVVAVAAVVVGAVAEVVVVGDRPCDLVLVQAILPGEAFPPSQEEAYPNQEDPWEGQGAFLVQGSHSNQDLARDQNLIDIKDKSLEGFMMSIRKL